MVSTIYPLPVCMASKCNLRGKLSECIHALGLEPLLFSSIELDNALIEGASRIATDG